MAARGLQIYSRMLSTAACYTNWLLIQSGNDPPGDHSAQLVISKYVSPRKMNVEQLPGLLIAWVKAISVTILYTVGGNVH